MTKLSNPEVDGFAAGKWRQSLTREVNRRPRIMAAGSKSLVGTGAFGWETLASMVFPYGALAADLWGFRSYLSGTFSASAVDRRLRVKVGNPSGVVVVYDSGTNPTTSGGWTLVVDAIVVSSTSVTKTIDTSATWVSSISGYEADCQCYTGLVLNEDESIEVSVEAFHLAANCTLMNTYRTILLAGPDYV